MRQIPLSELRPGQQALVLQNFCEPCLRGRLEDLGLTPGLTVRCIHRAPSGTPGAYDIRGACIALRRRDAACILVEVKEE